LLWQTLIASKKSESLMLMEILSEK